MTYRSHVTEESINDESGCIDSYVLSLYIFLQVSVECNRSVILVSDSLSVLGMGAILTVF